MQTYEKVFFLKLDGVGCLDPGCQQTIITETRAPGALEKEFELSPNPTRGPVNLTYRGWNEWKISDAQIAVRAVTGELVWSGRLENGSRQLALDGLAAGLYTVSLTSKGRVLYTGKIIKT